MEDWYSIRNKDIEENGGATLLSLYRDSCSLVLRNVFDHHEWLPWKFRYSPRKMFEDFNTTKMYIKFLEQKLDIY
jgi:hypothetical protein